MLTAHERTAILSSPIRAAARYRDASGFSLVSGVLCRCCWRHGAVLAANLSYTGLRAFVGACDVFAAVQGWINWEEVRWDPTDEDVRGVSPRLDAFRDAASARFQQAMAPVHRSRHLRQHDYSRV